MRPGIRPWKYCKCGRLCATGYCSYCRDADANMKIVERLEKNKKGGKRYEQN